MSSPTVSGAVLLFLDFDTHAAGCAGNNLFDSFKVIGVLGSFASVGLYCLIKR
jgi:hypothetical protein